MKSYTNLLWGFALFIFQITQVFSQTITNTATLYGSFSEPTGQSVTVPIPVDIVRSNGKILELHLNISNVTQTAKTLNLRVFELLYTSNVVETPKVDTVVVTPPPPPPTPTNNVVNPPVTNIVVNPPTIVTNPPTTITNPPVVINPTTTTNNVTLDVTLKLIDNTTKNVLLPGGIVKTNGQISNIIFDLTSVPTDAIIIRVRLYDYIYDENGNIIGIGNTNNNGGTITNPPSGGSTQTNNPVTPQNPSINSVQLPIEVLGEDQHTEEVKLVLNDNPSDVFGIKLQVHNLGFTNKMAISVNNSPWINLNNRNVDFTKQFDKAMFGMGGGHNTFTFVVPFASNNIIPSVTNIVKFKFNDLNKETVGYRVLDVDLVKAQPNGYELNYVHVISENPLRPTNWGLNTNLLNKYIPLNLATTKVKDDPSKWVPISTDASVINKGKELWFNGNISERGVPLNSKCTDCHASDGYDLKYFNYSDKSIIARSKYHGLNNDDGTAIAAYIRSLNVPYQEKGRPWNPPYQPGPGIDSKPVSSWAAGAGIESVADYDLETYKAIFPNGVDAGVKYDDGVGPIDFGKSLNMREIPIVIQFPDWKDWLPRHHLKDVAPDIWDYISKTNGYKLPTYFANALSNYKTNDPIWNLKNLYWGHNEVIGYSWVQMVQSPTTLLRNHSQDTNNVGGWQDIKIRNIIHPAWTHYTTVKHWEIMNKLGLQDIGHEIYDVNNKDTWNHPLWKSGYGGHDPVAFQNKYGFPITKGIQDRRWFDTYTFHLAPHIMGNSLVEDMSSPLWNKITWAPKSFMWYQLQMILDDSNKTPDRNIIDWGYLFALSWTPATHGFGEFDLFKIRSWGIHFLNTLKTDEAFFVNAGKQNNEVTFEGKYFPPRGESRSLGNRAEPWDGRSSSDSRYTFLVFSSANAAAFQNPEQRNYITKATSKIIDAEIDFMSKFDVAYLVGQGMDTGTIDMWDAGLRYAGGDDNNKTLNKVINFRTRLYPNYVYNNKFNHVYPDPWPNVK